MKARQKWGFENFRMLNSRELLNFVVHNRYTGLEIVIFLGE